VESFNFATKNEVIGRLRMAGLNMKEFAVREGYEPDTVRKVVGRYAGSNRTPRGVLTREILQKLGERIHCGGKEFTTETGHGPGIERTQRKELRD
jgi:lambda repressor-like predicted transcriptional regulator